MFGTFCFGVSLSFPAFSFYLLPSSETARFGGTAGGPVACLTGGARKIHTFRLWGASSFLTVHDGLLASWAVLRGFTQYTKKLAGYGVGSDGGAGGCGRGLGLLRLVFDAG